MALNFCLPPKTVENIKAAFVDGTLNPEKLASLSSEERRVLLSKYTGEAASKQVNAEFERTLLLKSQKQGQLNWAKNLTGMKESTKRDIIAKIKGMDTVLDPKDGTFLTSLAEQRLGVGITQEEAKTIADLSTKVTAAESKKVNGGFETTADRLAYGRAVYDMTDYVNDLKVKAKNLKVADFTTGNPIKASGKVVDAIAGNAKAINASLDNSSIFRQGWKTMWTHPAIWGKNAVKTFETLAKVTGGKNVLREVTADIVSRPNYQLMQKAKLAVGNLEEAFPTSFPEKIPGLGRLYKASEQAYTGFVQKTRADVFDKYIQIAKASGVDLADKKELESIGQLVNSLTGRGNLGKLEPVANTVNNVFFSPRFVKANIDTFTQPITGGKGSNFVRKQSAVNLLKVASGTATVLAIADMVAPNSVDWDPRSSDFGKIRVGDTRFDVTGGIGSLATLAARLATQSSKSSSSGKITQLNTGVFGSSTTFDTVVDFFSNKLSPIGGVIRDVLKGEDFNGNKITVLGEFKNAYLPMGVKTFTETLSSPTGAPLLVTMLADGLGISANTYSPAGGGGVSTWSKSSSAQIQAFKTKVGDMNFKKAASRYDAAFNSWQSGVKNNPQYKKLSTDAKAGLITKEKLQLQKDIFKQYKFEYKYPTVKKQDGALIQSLSKASK